MKPPQKPQQSKSFMFFKRTKINPGINTDTHSNMTHVDHCSSLPRGLSLSALRPLEATLHTAATGTLLQPDSYPIARLTNPS